MPFPPSLRLSTCRFTTPLRCGSLSDTSTHCIRKTPLFRQQKRVLLTTTHAGSTPPTRPAGVFLRSPLQWSHIVRRIRNPAGLTAAAAMGKNHNAAAQSRSHSGHSHSHGHNHDNTYLTSSNKSDAGVRITRIGLYVNLGMAIGKGVGGIVFNSQA